jgi:hypothetical protein
MRIIIKSLPGNDRGPRHMEAVLRAIHAANIRGLPISLEYRWEQGVIGFYAEFPDALRSTVLEHFQDAFPDCAVAVVREPRDPPAETQWIQTVRLRPDVLPLRSYGEFESTFEREAVDPATGLLAAVRFGSDDGFDSSITIRLRPASRSRILEAERILAVATNGFRSETARHFYLNWRTDISRLRRVVAILVGLRAGRTTETSRVTAGIEKTAQSLFVCDISVRVSGCKHAEARRQLQRMSGAFGPFATSQSKFVAGAIRRKPRRRNRGVLLSASELAMLMHPARSSVGVSKLSTESFREMEPPSLLPAKENDSEVTRIGRVRFRGQRRQFGMRCDDLRRHLFVCGRTGTGKSTLIRSMALDAIESGKNVFVVDPHGDLVESIIDAIPRSRTNDVIYFNAADRDYPVAFNPLDCPDESQRPLVADGLVLSLKKLYGDSWGPRLEQILRNSVLALLESEDATLLSVRQILTSKSFRTRIVTSVDDPVVRSFWFDTFDKWNDRFQTEAVSPVLNKLDGFLANRIARNITCQPRSTIRLRTIIDNPRSIFLCNLSKGLVGEQTSTLLGAFLVSSLQNAALSRADIPEEERNDVQVYIDEFQSFVSDGNSSFATLLSESRKYRVAFAALATQFLDQIDEATLSAVLGNCGSAVVFRSGVRDAETLAEHLGGVTGDDIVNLPNFTAYAKLLLNGEPTHKPFSMTVNPYQSKHRERGAVVREVSRKKYGCPIVKAEASLNARLR